MKNIKLRFEKSDTRLAGFQYGNKIYNEQVKDIIDFTNFDDITIIFPNEIEMVASSFIQGFFADIKEHVGFSGIENNITIKAATQDLAENIIKNIH